jgi:uncharacterized Zn finger protein|tara:strand:+ start:47 stop:295 length:249 start_codon:yes stop_codon:yes gene_type:complete
MNINFDKDYAETTYYYGTVDDEFKFTVSVDYNSNLETYVVDEIVWIDKEPPKKDKAIKRIMNIVYKWCDDHEKKSSLYAKDY